jgi:ankyrin repeat protein
MSSPTPAHRMIAAGFESVEALRALITSDPSLMRERTGLGETPLHYLAVENQVEPVRLLIENGAELNTLSDVGGTPLSEAASLGYEELVALLLSSGAQLHVEGQHEPTLHEAVRSGNVLVVEQVLSAGASTEEVNDLRETALHVAAESDERISVLQALLDTGADVAKRRVFDDTPLDVALFNGSTRCAELLQSRGAQRGSDHAA